MIGDVTDYNGKKPGTAAGGWLFENGDGSVQMSYLLVNAGLASMNSTYVDASTPFASSMTPHISHGGGTVDELWIGVGGEAVVNPKTYDAHFGIGFTANPAKFDRGIIFQE